MPQNPRRELPDARTQVIVRGEVFTPQPVAYADVVDQMLTCDLISLREEDQLLFLPTRLAWLSR